MSLQPTLVAKIILDSPLPQLDHPFDYAIPEHLQPSIALGQQVCVPLRNGARRANGWVVAIEEKSDFAGRLSAIESIVSDVPTLPTSLYGLAREVADRQAGSAVDVLRLAIPPRYVRAEKQFLATRPIHTWKQTPSESLSNVIKETSDPSRQEEEREPSRAFTLAPAGIEVLPSGECVPGWIAKMVQRLQESTSSEQSAIIVVPDFRDIARVERTLTDVGLAQRIIRTDASIPGAQRWTNYLRMLSGEPLIVLGNRSAIYAPVTSLTNIYIWDDNDDALDEPHAPYAHVRDVALLRQQREKCDLEFAGFVPSPAIARLVNLEFLEFRDEARHWSKTIPTDTLMTHSDAPSGRIPSVVYAAIKEGLTRGNVLVQVAKPGFSASMRCATCREPARCRSCGGPLRKSTSSATPGCHWCGALQPHFACPECSGTTLMVGKPGSGKTGEELGKAFPGTRVVVCDADHLYDTVDSTNTLVIATPGTEPLSAGGYDCVVILDGESARARENLNADIDALNTWLSALALISEFGTSYIVGSGDELGRVIATHSVLDFVSKQVSERATLGLPPTTRSAVLTCDQSAVNDIRDDLHALPIRSILGPVQTPQGEQRLVVTFDYRNGAEVSRGLRALIVTSATASRRSVARGDDSSFKRVSRLNVRMDESFTH